MIARYILERQRDIDVQDISEAAAVVADAQADTHIAQQAKIAVADHALPQVRPTSAKAAAPTRTGETDTSR